MLYATANSVIPKRDGAQKFLNTIRQSPIIPINLKLKFDDNLTTLKYDGADGIGTFNHVLPMTDCLFFWS